MREEELFQNKNILLVDDEGDLREIVSSEFQFMGAKIFEAENILVASKICEAQPLDLVITDIRMPGGTGIDLLKLAKVNHPFLPFILMSGFADIKLDLALDLGAEALINKPFKLDDLIKTALRLISPFEARFSENNQATKKLFLDLSNGDLSFGRGGASFFLEKNEEQLDVGDVIDFELLTKDFALKGVGICRWLRSVNHHESTFVGLEFLRLDPESLKFFKMIYESQVKIPFIPSAKI